MSNTTQGLTGPAAVDHLGHGDGQQQQLLQAIQAQKIEGANKFKAARSYSRRVQKLKIALPVIGAIFIALFVGIAYLSQFSTLPLGFAAIDLTNGQIVMERPTLNGFTSSDAEYEIVAERALQDLTDPKKVLLEKISATLTLDDGNIVSIDAGKGRFNVKGQHLVLSDGISMHMSSGYTGELDSATIDIKGGMLTSKGDVFVKADIG
ncbi:MAG: hypothetical protein ABJZ62_05595, partial [Hyphomicrobiales bacterium]